MYRIIRYRKIDKDPARMEAEINQAIQGSRLIGVEYDENPATGSAMVGLTIGEPSEKSPAVQCRIFRTTDPDTLDASLNTITEIPVKLILRSNGRSTIALVFFAAKREAPVEAPVEAPAPVAAPAAPAESLAAPAAPSEPTVPQAKARKPKA